MYGGGHAPCLLCLSYPPASDRAVLPACLAADDGLVMKKTLADTEEWARPNAGAQCTISYAARLLPAAGGTLFDERTADNPLLFTTDEGGGGAPPGGLRGWRRRERRHAHCSFYFLQIPCIWHLMLLPAGQVPDGLDRAVRKMKTGERALVTVAPQYAFGAQARVCCCPELGWRLLFSACQCTREAGDLSLVQLMSSLPPSLAACLAAAGAAGLSAAAGHCARWVHRRVRGHADQLCQGVQRRCGSAGALQRMDA